MSDLTTLSDNELLREWEDTKAVAASLRPTTSGMHEGSGRDLDPFGSSPELRTGLTSESDASL